VAAVRRTLDDCGAPEGRIRVDVNGAWSVEEALTRLELLDAVAGGLEYAEQPCATLDELADLRARGAGGVRIAVDEGVRLAGEAQHGDEQWVERVRAAADVLVLKAVPIGGVRRSLDLARAVGLPVTVSGALDSTVGLGASLALAAALPDAPYACGLGTGRLLAADLTAVTALPRDGRLAVPAVPVAPDPAQLAAARARVDDARAAWWLARLARCLALFPATPAGAG
jgi:O-succinylbenzoate synthase